MMGLWSMGLTIISLPCQRLNELFNLKRRVTSSTAPGLVKQFAEVCSVSKLATTDAALLRHLVQTLETRSENIMFTVIPKQNNVVDEKTTDKIRAVSAENTALVSKVEYLEDNINRLTLITQALWEILQKRVGIEESELTALIEEIDLRDGELDGKITKKPQKCSKCNQTVSVKTNVCVYCGHKEQS